LGPVIAVNFPTTSWSLVLAVRGGDDDASSAAMEELCRRYWHPAYAFIRHSDHNHHDAQDLTQAFFQRLIEKRCLDTVDRERGRFRA
jgi:RNA polymerase sigma-70 factor (ECF subfamily)